MRLACLPAATPRTRSAFSPSRLPLTHLPDRPLAPHTILLAVCCCVFLSLPSSEAQPGLPSHPLSPVWVPSPL